MINRRNFLKSLAIGSVGIGVLKTNSFSLFAIDANDASVFGEGAHPMHNHSKAMDVLRYWNNVEQDDVALYESALNVFEANKTSTYVEVLKDETYLKRIAKYDRKLLGKPMLANLRKDAVSLWLRTPKPQEVQVEYSNGSETLLSDVCKTNFDKDLSAVLELKNLKSDTRYTYSIIIDGQKYSAENFYFDSLPSGDKLRIAFGTCPHRWGLGNAKLFNAIKNRKPSLMLLYGDIAAQGKGARLALHRADYLLRDFQSVWSNFVCNVPVYASWDDHDYFSNDKSGIPDGCTDADRRGVRKVFINSWANPSYGNGDEGIYTKFSVGLCDVIMTDNRYFREGGPTPKVNKKTGKIDEKALARSKIKKEFLGKMQMQWLKDELSNAKGKFIILTCGTMWSDYVSDGKDSWGVYDPRGREEIYSLIEEKGIAGVLLLSGDRHGARIFSIDRAKGFKLYEFNMASLGARICGGVGDTQWDNQLFNKQGIFAFGEFNFNMQEGKESVEVNIIGEDEDILFNHKFTRSELCPPKA